MGTNRAVEHAAALAAITQAITTSLDAATVFHVLDREARRILPHDGLWVLFRSSEPPAEQWIVALSPPGGDTPAAFPLHAATFAVSLLAAQATLVDDFRATAPVAQLDAAIVAAGGRAAIIVPIHVATRVLGGLIVTRASPAAFDATDLPLIQPLADLVALAKEHDQLNRQASSLAVVEERNRLAREIHDTLAQSLTAIILNLESLKLYSDAQPDVAVDILAETEALARSALTEARRSVLGLHPSSLAHQSLAPALQQELDAFGRRAQVATQFYRQGAETDLAPDQSTALFRIAQEALQNIAKHAVAKTVLMGLTFGSDTVTLTIEDDGVGYAPTTLPSPNVAGGSGLLGMEARAASLGGALKLTSAPDHGTLVEAILPYNRPPAAGIVRLPIHTTGTPVPIRVLIVDDHPVTRQGLRRILGGHPDLAVVGEADNGVAAVAQARTLQPDVVLLDLQMPQLGGIAAIPQLQAVQPSIEVVVLTTFDQEEHVFAALKAGARGYLLKDAAPETLLSTIRAAARGESLLPLDVATRVVERFVLLAQRETDPDALSAREMEVLHLMARGRPYKEIATTLNITTKTVQYHVGNILGKLHVRSRGEAVAVATERGLLSAPSS